jgi:hypothetical protein
MRSRLAESVGGDVGGVSRSVGMSIVVLVFCTVFFAVLRADNLYENLRKKRYLRTQSRFLRT